MAREIREFQFTVPAGTPIAVPVTQNIIFPPRIVNSIRYIVPAGVNGFMGFRIAASGVPIIPYNNQAWIVTNDDKVELPLNDYIDSGSWQIQGYNTGIYPHTVYLRFLLSLVGDPASAVPQIINPAAFSGP